MAIIKTFILIGPPGSGKGTQAEILAKSLGGVHLSSGEILRDEASAELKSEMDRGELVEEPEVDKILEEALMAAPQDKTWILDGFVRMPQDREWLESALTKMGRSLDLVIIIEVPEDICRERVMKRGRTDDTASAWVERWSEFEEVTVPVIESLAKNKCIRVDGSKDPETINKELISKLSQQGVGND